MSTTHWIRNWVYFVPEEYQGKVEKYLWAWLWRIFKFQKLAKEVILLSLHDGIIKISLRAQELVFWS